MLKTFKANQSNESKLYNKILSLSRNKLLYNKICLSDTFQNRINLIFIHASFLFIKLKQKHQKQVYRVFYQKMFDLIFKKIELNMRELGYGDVSVNKNMKFLIGIFYNILLESENYINKSASRKKTFLTKYLTQNIDNKSKNGSELMEYFNNYQAFCFDLKIDSVLKGDLEFKY